MERCGKILRSLQPFTATSAQTVKLAQVHPSLMQPCGEISVLRAELSFFRTPAPTL